MSHHAARGMSSGNAASQPSPAPAASAPAGLPPNRRGSRCAPSRIRPAFPLLRRSQQRPGQGRCGPTNAPGTKRRGGQAAEDTELPKFSRNLDKTQKEKSGGEANWQRTIESAPLLERSMLLAGSRLRFEGLYRPAGKGEGSKALSDIGR